ncbi:hypothetical protein PY650_30900 [Rhizobium calliandrae]|uniref:Uncharacterized protein n=1 Tax=Rhizobium calliandrae TaxID=1312182 RepID=A0ABT7KMT5_9HYPH|nr:hypothetical protein [Rhizobium calliandrae]MDL2409948.1 hypothetical protein [Rhizobium calliandrae]
MATPKQLVAKVAELTGVPEGTVVQHDRNLSVAELRTTGGRGLAVAKVTFEDAANLLIAVAGSRNVKDSVKTVREYRELVSSQPLDFGDVRRGHTFGDALSALIEATPKDRDLFSGGDGGTIEVSIFGPSPAARIEWHLPTSHGAVEYTGQRSRAFADLQFVSKFSQVTIGHVGDLVSD